MGMPLDVFTIQAYEALVSGNDQIIVDNPNFPMDKFNAVVDTRRELFDLLSERIRGAMGARK
jgi:hypothetical protein